MTMKEKDGCPAGYVRRKDGTCDPIVTINTHHTNKPIIGITTTAHQELTPATLRDAIQSTLQEKKHIRQKIGNNWYPIGFAWLKVPGNSDIVKLIKKHGTKSTQSEGTWHFDKIHITKNYGEPGYSIKIDHNPQDALELQSLNYKQPLYAELAKQLALLDVRTEQKSYID